MLPTPIADPGSQAFIDGELAAEDSEAEADNSTAKTRKRRILWHPWMDVVLLKEVYARSPWPQNQIVRKNWVLGFNGNDNRHEVHAQEPRNISLAPKAR